MRVWATEWDVFHCTPSRGSRGRRAAVDIFRGVCFLVPGGIFFFVFFTSNAHGLLQVQGNLASCTSLLAIRQGRGSEATEAIFCRYAEKPLRAGVRTGCHYLVCRCVCACAYHSSFLLIVRAVRGRFPQTRDLWKQTSVGERVGRVSLNAVSRWSRWSGCCGLSCVFSVGRIFLLFISHHFHFFERIRPASSTRLPLSSFTSLVVAPGRHFSEAFSSQWLRASV